MIELNINGQRPKFPLVGIQFELKIISEIGVETNNGQDLKSNEIPIKKGRERMITKEIIIQLFLNFSM